MKKPEKVLSSFNTYTIKDLIGEGGSGVVYSVKDDAGEDFAIKILNPNKSTKDKLKRFKNEYSFCAKNTHPNIITVLDHGLAGDTPFFVMPLYDYSLRKIINGIEPDSAVKIFYQILDGVEAAHLLGVIHRDLKPENILINDDNNAIVVTDFGIARFSEEDLYTAVETKDSTRLANFQYAAPEQRTRGMAVGQTADIYALGIILNELFTSNLAYGTGFKKIESVSDDYTYLDPIVDMMLQQDPTNRYQNIDEIKKDLIARENEHISRQKLNRLKTEVVPTTDIEDPLIIDPMKIVGVDWENNTLTIKLNHNANETWIWAIKHMDNYTSTRNAPPEAFQFKENKAIIRVRSNSVQVAVDNFKAWIPQANQKYKDKITKNIKIAERKEREEMSLRIKKEEERMNVLQNIKF